MKEIQFTLTIEEANLILEGLGSLAFARVNPLINKLQAQAKPQVAPESPKPKNPTPPPK